MSMGLSSAPLEFQGGAPYHKKPYISNHEGAASHQGAPQSAAARGGAKYPAHSSSVRHTLQPCRCRPAAPGPAMRFHRLPAHEVPVSFDATIESLRPDAITKCRYCLAADRRVLLVVITTALEELAISPVVTGQQL